MRLYIVDVVILLDCPPIGNDPFGSTEQPKRTQSAIYTPNKWNVYICDKLTNVIRNAKCSQNQM